MTLKYAIERGLKEEAHHITRDLIGTREPLDIIQEELIPALNVVGEGFEKGTVFLPQLLMSADAAKTLPLQLSRMCLLHPDRKKKRRRRSSLLP